MPAMALGRLRRQLAGVFVALVAGLVGATLTHRKPEHYACREAAAPALTELPAVEVVAVRLRGPP
jgi:hypothetical protein